MTFEIIATWDVDGALAALDRLIEGLAHPGPLMQDIGDTMERNIALRFETKNDPSGVPWAPISPVTRSIWASDWFIKANPAFKDGPPGSLLQRTNAMRASLAHNASDDAVEVGFSRATRNGRWEVAMLHEWGTSRMPRRGLMTADPATGQLGIQDQQDIIALLNDYLTGLF